MPSTKRPLAQANANVILPMQKKNKEKSEPFNNDYESKTKGELMEILKERAMSSSGTKEMLIRRLRVSEGYAAPDNVGETGRRKSARIEAAGRNAKSLEDRERRLETAGVVKNVDDQTNSVRRLQLQNGCDKTREDRVARVAEEATDAEKNDKGIRNYMSTWMLGNG